MDEYEENDYRIINEGIKNNQNGTLQNIEKALDDLSNKAIQQIKDNKYDYGLKGKVIYIGLAHHGKDVSIKWEERYYFI